MAQGIAKFDGVCKKCGGEIKAHVTLIRWAPALRGSQTHEACYYAQEVTKRNANGVVVDGSQPIPDVQPIPGEIPSDNKVQSDTDEEAPREPKPTQQSKPANGKPDGIAELIAGMVLPIIEEKLSTKVDTEAVNAIAKNAAETAVLDAASILREAFTTKIVIERADTGETRELPGLQHRQLADVIKIMKLGLGVYLYDAQGGKGGPGAGKTTAAKQVADALGVAFYHISLNIMSQPTLITGYLNASGTYVSTDFRKAYENGGLFLFDELDNANGNFLTSLNTGLANGSMSFPDGIVTRHKEFFAMGAGNTNGTGANALHNSRQLLDAASRERFVFYSWEYDEKLERKVALAYNKESEPWVSFIQNTRKQVHKLGVKMVCSPRASIYGAQLLADFKPEQVADMVLFKGIDADTRNKVLANTPLPVM